MADPSPETAAQLQQLESSYADNPGRYFVPYAGLLRETGQPERAEEVLRENLKRFPGLSAHVLLGRCLADRGAHQEASNEFHYVLSIDAQNLIALRSLAEIAAAGGRTDEARRWYGELLSVDPMNADARAAVARLGAAAADAATADQPAGTLDAWPGADEPLAPAAGAGDEPETEWGNLELEDGFAPADGAGGETGAFDALDFGGVELPAADEGPLDDAGARQDPAEAASLPFLDFGPDAEDEDGAAPAGEEPGEPEVVTETMAELYASQGLTGRAAEVYRELIQRRGEEPGLVRRLAELEGRGAPPEEAALPPLDLGDSLPSLELDAGDPEPGGEDDFAASVSAGFGAEPEEARAAWSPPEVAKTDAAGGFDLLVIDDSAPLDGDLHPPETAEEAAELSADWAVAAAPLQEQEEAVEAAAGTGAARRRTMRGYFAALLAWAPVESEAEAAGAEPAAEPEPGYVPPASEPRPEPWADPEPAAPAGDEPEEPLPWELPAEDAPPAGEETQGGGGFSFEDFFGGGAAAPEAEAAPEVPAEPAPEPPALPEPARGGTEAAAAPDAGDEDEDLESFQAWLQSLKR